MERSKLDAATLIGVSVTKGFAIWAKNLLPFLVLTTVIYSPLILWAITAASGGFEDVKEYTRHSVVLAVALATLTSAAVTYGTVMTMRGRRASFGACVSTGLYRLLPAIGTLVVIALCFVGITMLIGIPIAAVADQLDRTGVLLVGGAIAFVYFWLVAMLFVAMPVCAVEEPGIVAALGRSRALTRGHRFAIGLLVVMLVVVWAVVTAIIKQALVGPALIYGELVRDLLFGSIGAVVIAVAYSLLRQEKDGTTVDELAQVFG